MKTIIFICKCLTAIFFIFTGVGIVSHSLDLLIVLLRKDFHLRTDLCPYYIHFSQQIRFWIWTNGKIPHSKRIHVGTRVRISLPQCKLWVKSLSQNGCVHLNSIVPEWLNIWCFSWLLNGKHILHTLLSYWSSTCT